MPPAQSGGLDGELTSPRHSYYVATTSRMTGARNLTSYP